MKILIADDHRLVLEAVRSKLSEIGPDIEFVLALTVEELFTGVGGAIDLAVIDLNMPGGEGHAHIGEVRRRHPSLPIVVLSGTEDPAVMREVMDRGVLGFIPKAYSPQIMLSAIRLVLAGGIYVPPMMLWALPSHGPAAATGATEPNVTATVPNTIPAAAGAALDHLRNVLTERQIEVLALLSRGMPNKLIGRSLGISEGTVKIHLAAIFRALGVRNRTEAVVSAQVIAEA